MADRSRAIAFDVDTVSLAALREALPQWRIDSVSGATVTSLPCDWGRAGADFLVLGVRVDVRETLALCRFLAFCTPYSGDFQQEGAVRSGPGASGPALQQRGEVPLLVLVPSGQAHLVEPALEAGAHGCLLLPIHAKDVAGMLVHARAGNQPGRHTLNLEGAQSEDCWRDDGGQG